MHRLEPVVPLTIFAYFLIAARLVSSSIAFCASGQGIGFQVCGETRGWLWQFLMCRV